MQFEWICKYPTRRKPRPKIYSGPKGRMDSLASILSFIPDSEKKQMILYIHPDFMFVVDKYNLSHQIRVQPLADILVPTHHEVAVKPTFNNMSSVPGIGI